MITAGENWIYTRWARATYLHTKTGNKKAFIKDLNWVLNMDPHKADSPYPATVYFQRDAKEMIENIDDYFK